MLVAMNITDKKHRKAILLHYAGEEVHDIFTTLTVAQNEEDLYKQALDALDAYIVPKRVRSIIFTNSGSPNRRQEKP